MTVSSEIDICNLALDHLNVKSISSISPPNTSLEELCKRWYDQTRRWCLRRYPWNFATKRVVLAADATDPPFGWSKQFTLPADFIRLKYINESILVRDNPIPASAYTIEDGKILVGDGGAFADTNELRLVYIYDFKTVPQMDSTFVDFFATAMAQNMAYKLSQSNSNVERLNALMEKSQSAARAMNGQDNPPIRVERSRSRRARRSRSGVRNLDGTIVFLD